jgi:hypothetical protein
MMNLGPMISKTLQNCWKSMDKEKLIKDRGGTRSGNDRRQQSIPIAKVEQREGEDRRNGGDRRRSLGRKRNIKNGDGVERRTVFREK